MKTFNLLLLAAALGVATAATHVNISIAQHAVTNPADVTYIDGEAPAELKAGPAKQTPASVVERSSRLQNAANAAPAPSVAAEPKRAYATAQRYEQLKQAREQSRRNQEFERYIQHYHSGPTVETVYESASAAEPQRLTAASSSGGGGQSQRYVAIGGGRSAQQFERQVALPNSGSAAVEAAPNAAANAPAANVESERQQAAAPMDVAAPAAAINSNGGAYDAASSRAARVGLEPVNYDAPVAAAAPATAGYGNAPSHEQDQLNNYNNNGNNNNNNLNYEPQPQLNLHAYNSNNNNNNYDTQPQVNLHSHIPPAPVQEDYSGYGLGRNEHQFPLYAAAAGGGGGGGGAYLPQYPQQFPQQATEYQPTNDYQPHEYLPAEYQPAEYQPRPVVTKTIQIAQPALKAKKFEVRHPAIQKEFYDIEERVVIKPAGTIVVELEHPVAKIPRGETILPLGHPHPAVAGAYNLQPQHGYAAPSQSQSPSRAYGVSNADLAAAAYAPAKAEPSIVGSTTIASNLMATPSVGAHESQKARNDYIEQNLARQYNSPAPIAADAPQQQQQKTIAVVAPAPVNEPSDEYFVLTDSQGNQRRISSKLFTPNVLGKDEPDRAAPRGRQQPTSLPVEARRGSNVQLQSQPQPQQQPMPQHAYAYTANNNNNNNNNNNQVRYQQSSQQQQQQQQPSQQYKNSDFYDADTLDADADADVTGSSAATAAEPARSARLELAAARQPLSEPQLRLRQHDFDLVQMVKRLKLQQQQQQHARPELGHAARELYQLPRGGNGHGVYVPYAAPANANAAVAATVVALPSGGNGGSSSSSAASVRPAYARVMQDSKPSVEYSAPYSNMRYVPQQTARYAAPPQQNPFDEIDRFSDFSPARAEQQPAQTHIQIQLPHGQGGGHSAPQRIMVSSTIAPAAPQSAQYNRPHSANSELAADCEPHSERLIAQSTRGGQQKFLRLVDAKSASESATGNEKASSTAASTAAAAPAAVVAAAPTTPTLNSAVENVDVSSKGVSGHVAPVVGAGQRVIAATPAPTGASGSESLHSRRIVVNHPFQTVREVVEHEPVTNYHEVQVNEPTYNFNAPYIQQLTQRTNGALKQFDPTDYQFAYGRQ